MIREKSAASPIYAKTVPFLTQGTKINIVDTPVTPTSDPKWSACCICATVCCCSSTRTTARYRNTFRAQEIFGNRHQTNRRSQTKSTVRVLILSVRSTLVFDLFISARCQRRNSSTLIYAIGRDGVAQQTHRSIREPQSAVRFDYGKVKPGVNDATKPSAHAMPINFD